MLECMRFFELFEQRLNVIRGGFLGIFLAGVGDHRYQKRILGVIRGVVNMQAFLDVFGQFSGRDLI